MVIKLKICFFSVFVLFPIAVSTTTLVANFDMQGISGTIQFEQTGSGNITTITVMLTGLEENVFYDWNIMEFPVFYDLSDKCAVTVLGDSVYDLGLAISLLTSSLVDGDMYTVTSVELTGVHSIQGRSILLDNGSDRVCATISLNQDIINAVAILHMPVAGVILFQQLASDSTAVTTIDTDLFYVDGTTGDVYDWSVYTNTNGVDYETSNSGKCDDTISVYNPIGSDNTNCGTSMQENCQIGHLSGKLAGLTIGTYKGVAINHFVDTNLPLSGENSIIGRTLVILTSNGEKLACGYITQLNKRKVTSEFNSDGVTGTISFSQSSSLHPTLVEVNLNNLQNQAHTYHVHEFPVPHRKTTDDSLCNSYSVGGHWNPYNVVDSPATGTNDQYEIGDLSGKYGTISGTSFSGSYIDFNLPLFGQNSIIGRSIVIHKSDGSRWVCANINYPTSTLTAIAVFNAPIGGYIMMRQDDNDPFSDTSVFVDIAYVDGTVRTTNHDWHVHVEKLADDYLSDESRCASVSGHYNPYQVSLDDSYSAHCNNENQQRCELGDFAGKHGQLVIASDLSMIGGKAFFTDTQMALSGTASVIGRSIVIHESESGTGRLACADIHEFKHVVTRSDNWSDDSIFGFVELTQTSLFDPVTVDIDLSGLQSSAGGYHIHILPILSGADPVCGEYSVQGHFNPFGILGSADTGTHDMYEVGDLSGKFGSLNGLDFLAANYSDYNCALTGAQSVVGRSIVIHRDDESGSRWSCSDIVSQLDSFQYKLNAVASWDTSIFLGSISFSQIHYSDGRLGDTTLVVDISSNSQQDLTYNWSIHEGFNYDCSGIGDVFNPYRVSAQDNYNILCSVLYHSHCQVGDLSGRHGYPGTRRVLFTDSNIPLFGDASVIGRTIMLTPSDGSVPSCQTIEPTTDTAAQASLGFASLVAEFNAYDFRKEVSAFCGIDMWQVIATRDIENTIDGCQAITFWFAGTNSDDIKADFLTRSQGEEGSTLGIYAPTDNCPMQNA
ncbi:uncharacterized protein LOC100377119, partial [Saccoglossus kowalevskii]|uniref:Uncharacterized protein LOC100377119 n=1 Tax=Saccoglossus kowalevskii TaxID=10224 RepID=A0ABM0GP72_SACKO